MVKNVGWLDISVNDVSLMKFIETLEYIIGKLPNFFLWYFCFVTDCLLDASLKITLIGVLHNDTQHFCLLVVEGFLVADDKRRLDGGQEPDLVESILFVFFFEFLQLDLNRWGGTCFMA
jgi:hypothetical protein